MADQKITQLSEHLYTSVVGTDVLPVVDITNGITKKITYAGLHTHAHCTLSDSNTKTVASTTAEYAVTFNGNDDLLGITHSVGDSKIYVPTAGDYLIIVSAVIDTTNNTAALFDLWVKINGTNLAKSNTQVGINNSNLQQVLSVNFILDLNAGDYFELFYHASSTNARMLAVAEAASPTRPACPSIIVTVNKCSW